MKKMKYGFVGIIVAVVLVFIYFFFFNKEGVNEYGEACVKVNRAKFTRRWDGNNIPGLDREAAAYFPEHTDSKATGYAIAGFCKAIDVLPSEGVVKFYQKQIKAWLASPKGIPHWQIALGEHLCKQ